jgi:hypothetical protein
LLFVLQGFFRTLKGWFSVRITVTVKAEAESRGELIDSFGGQFSNMRKHFDSLKTEGVFGDPERVAIRYVAIGGQFNPEEEAQGVPDVE